MAKKKTETASAEKKDAPARKPPAAEKKAAAPAAASKPASTAGKPPAIDTSLAANAAAAMIANKASGAGGNKAHPPRKESSTFKQLKAGLNKPAAGALGGAFGIGAKQQKKATQNYGGGQQIGHNQTFGSDVNRAGVPRRTPG